MRIAKELVVTATVVAILIASQFVLSFVSGVEIVTAVFGTYCFTFGVKRGVVVATVFSLARCFLFGFFPTVIILYLVYYNLFAIVIGVAGKCFAYKANLKSMIAVSVLAVLLTGVLTLLDNIITPTFYSFDADTTKAYWIASVATLIPHLLCSLISVVALFYPLTKAYGVVNLPRKA